MIRFTATIQFAFEREIEIFADSIEEAYAAAENANISDWVDAKADVVFDVREEE